MDASSAPAYWITNAARRRWHFSASYDGKPSVSQQECGSSRASCQYRKPIPAGVRSEQGTVRAVVADHMIFCTVPDSRGIENENVAPGPSFGMAQRRPLWLSMIERLMDSPTPIPWVLVV